MKKSIFLFLTGVLLIMCLSGCGKTKYNLLYDGYGFESKKTKYTAGETVTVYYDLIATDTDYSFFLDCDDVSFKQDYDNSHGYVFTFTMPDHDVTIGVKSRNSMEYDPGAMNGYGNNPDGADDGTDAPAGEGMWACPECGYNANTGGFCSNCGRKKDA